MQIGALGAEHIGAQVKRRHLQHAGGQLLELVAHLCLQWLHEPFGQVVTVLGHQAVRRNGVTFVQPFHFERIECAFDKAARASKPQDCQAPLTRAAARAGQRLKQGFLAQHCIGRLSQGAPLARAQVAVVSEISRHHGICRVFKSQDLRHQLGAGI
ncbi:hypothetical protein D3C72_1831430 [compost metagenome]